MNHAADHTTKTYLASRHAIELCLKKQLDKDYYARAQSLWLWHKAQEMDSLIAQAHSLKIPVQIIQSPDKIPEYARQDMLNNQHILWIEPIHNDINTFDWDKARTLVVVDHITDAQNLGAIIRSACALQVDALFYPKNAQASVSSRVRFIAQGAAELLPCYRIPNVNQWLSQAQKKGFWVYGFCESGTLPLNTTIFSTKCVLVIGSEDQGIRNQTAALCDYLVNIPTSPSFSCLNAASAASIIMYERFRQLLL